MNRLEKILGQDAWSREDLAHMLSRSSSQEVARLSRAAYDSTTRLLGNKVFLRGIVEFSNRCALNCFYCGIRAGNTDLNRYTMSRDQIVECALWCASAGYGSCVLQSGERRDEAFVALVEECVRVIRERSRSARLPRGLGITLSAGEQSPATYRRWRAAGADRYLLRIETANPRLFAELHPSGQRFEDRLRCLIDLRGVGFQVGTGVMIGLPGQTLEDLADDILFFARQDVDMIGMGPYIVHAQSPMRSRGMMEERRLMQLSLNMIAVTRLVLRNVNIAATTALQALVADGREQGIAYGANVIMPNVTPRALRRRYQLYDGKPCVEEEIDACRECVGHRIVSTGREIGWDERGDSEHFTRRAQMSVEKKVK